MLVLQSLAVIAYCTLAALTVEGLQWFFVW